MSEFSIEEKANAYDLALNKAKTLLSKCKRVSDKASMIYRAEDIENIFPELQKTEEEKIKEALIALVKCNERCGYSLLNNVSTSSMLAWLEKQGQSKKTSIWKHWKNGICGNGEGKLVFLIKSGATYSLSSCLSFECDYIELSELDNLMLEKQDNSNKEYWRGYREGKQEVLDKYAELEKQGNPSIKWNENTKENKPSICHSILMKTTHGIVEGEWKGEDWCQYRWSTNHIKDSDVLAWMELSDLDKSFDKVEPKFKIGDWIVEPREGEPNGLWHIDRIEDGYYWSDKCGCIIEYADKNFHLWTIEDAKDGDVLVYGDNQNHNHVEVIMLFKSLRNERSAFTHFHIFIDMFRIDDWCDCGKNVHPATKEQRDLLFTKMKEAGYEWNEDKKELKKLEKQNEQKLIWDKFDDLMLKDVLEFIETGWSGNGKSHLIYWLKSIKDKFK